MTTAVMKDLYLSRSRHRTIAVIHSSRKDIKDEDITPARIEGTEWRCRIPWPTTPNITPLPSTEGPVARRTDGNRQPDMKKHNVLHTLNYICIK